MDLENQLKVRIEELNGQKQKCNQLIQNLNRESLMIDGMLSEALKTFNSYMESKKAKQEEPKKRRGGKPKGD